MKAHFVTFYSPGTFVPETTTREIESWDPKRAVAMAETIVERYGARPHFFGFTTRERGDKDLDSKEVARSPGYFFLGGRLETLDEVEARNDPKERILRSNMRCNEMVIIVVVERIWTGTQPFRPEDVIVDAKGAIVERGDDPKHVAYRAQVASRLASERG